MSEKLYYMINIEVNGSIMDDHLTFSLLTKANWLSSQSITVASLKVAAIPSVWIPIYRALLSVALLQFMGFLIAKKGA